MEMPGIDISRVRTRVDIKEFVELPWRVYRDDGNWTPPIKKKVMDLIHCSRHPFWQFAERELFLARRGGRAVGRIAAIIDRKHNEHVMDMAGAWGFFECCRDPEAAVGLFWAAEEWIRQRQMRILRGPLSPSLNYEAGLLVKGFDIPSTIMLPYNPPYYADFVYACGYGKEKDLYSFRIPKDYQPPAWAYEISRQVVDRDEFTLRMPGRKNFPKELVRFNALFAECWKDNWGFVPMTPAEIDYAAKEFIQLIEPEFAFFICHRNREIGVFLGILDANPFLKRLNGKLGLAALVRKLLYWPEINGLRVLLFGIMEEFRDKGAAMVVFDHLMKRLRSEGRFNYIEAGWTLADNQSINHIFGEGGLTPSRILRIFRKDVNRANGRVGDAGWLSAGSGEPRLFS